MSFNMTKINQVFLRAFFILAVIVSVNCFDREVCIQNFNKNFGFNPENEEANVLCSLTESCVAENNVKQYEDFFKCYVVACSKILNPPTARFYWRTSSSGFSANFCAHILEDWVTHHGDSDEDDASSHEHVAGWKEETAPAFSYY
ncbi:uncharacterized protein LOC123296284 [Chrysoperla carnea]|uniref:uncharacterized protein LOC123296284 n=1 Tax=Chrysoperla carnea TaxID=189513 RepID=UPI001D05CB5E|nr:uncharacterized protein LOC123296284 [Chrysoperla carnea]